MAATAQHTRSISDSDMLKTWHLYGAMYETLPVAHAEQYLICTLRDIDNIVSAMFLLEGEAVIDSTKEIHLDAVKIATERLVQHFALLKPANFLRLDGSPCPEFYDAVKGLCGLWTSTDFSQLSSTMTHIAMVRPAATISRLACTRRIRLSAAQRFYRNNVASVDATTTTTYATILVPALVICVLAAYASIAGALPAAVLIGIFIVFFLLAALSLAALVVIVLTTKRSDQDFRVMFGLLVSAGALGGGAAAEEPASLGGMLFGGGLGGMFGGGGTEDNDAEPSNDGLKDVEAIKKRFPYGALLVPLLTDGVHGTWIAFDARGLNRQIAVIGFDHEKRVVHWNEGAQELSGFVSASRLGDHLGQAVALSDEVFSTLHKRVHETVPVGLKSLASGTMQLLGTIVEMKDAKTFGGIGHAFVCPAVQDNLKATKEYLHEYHSVQLHEQLTSLSQLLGEALQSANEHDAAESSMSSSAGRPAGGLKHQASQSAMIPNMNPLAGAGVSRASSGAAVPPSSERSESLSSNALAAEQQLRDIATDMRIVLHAVKRCAGAMQNIVDLSSWHILNQTARSVNDTWEWTNGESLVGAAARNHRDSASVFVESGLPKSFRLPAVVVDIAKTIINEAPGRCNVILQWIPLTARVSKLCFTVQLENEAVSEFDVNRSASVSRQSMTLEVLRRMQSSMSQSVQAKFDYDKLVRMLSSALVESCAAFQLHSHDTVATLTFPYVHAALTLESTAQAEGQAAPDGIVGGGIVGGWAAKCEMSVAICLDSVLDRQNIGMILLGVTGVSLAICRNVEELIARLPTVDMTIVDIAFMTMIETSEAVRSIVIPAVEVNWIPSGDLCANQVVQRPFNRVDISEMVVAASAVIAENKQRQAVQEERDAILRARHDSRWTKGKLLGKGTFGAAYEAIDDLTGGKSAVKQFYFVAGADDAAEEQFFESLANEIAILSKLSHPNIVHYFHCERGETEINIFMEICEHSIDDIVQARAANRGRLELAAPSIIRQTLLAVAYLHERGIIHRDIKPQNMLVRGDQMKLTDFGTAKQLRSSDEDTHDTQGTLRFMAPEVYKSQSYNWSCDIWSVGCLLCELLAVDVEVMKPGQMNCALDTITEDVVVAHAVGIKAEARAFIEACLKINKDGRPPATALLLHPYLFDADEAPLLSTLTPSQDGAPEAPAGALGDFSLSSGGSEMRDEHP
jgi:hypothetical protein